MQAARPWFDGFEAQDFVLEGARIHARTGGRAGAPPLLLLHGFPQTHAMWHRVAQRLAPHFQLVLPDLRGYGRSAPPTAAPATPDHAQHSKRATALDLARLMRALGHAHYAVCGHDRGARVAHRLPLDHPAAVTRLALIDIAPTLDMYTRTDKAFATAYYHWFHLIQPAPLPEKMIGGCARDYLHAKLGGWGGQGTGFIEPEALADYETSFCRPEAIHAACEDYRASAGIDLEHDRASRAAGEKIGCNTLVLWGARGVVARLFEPLALWQAQCAARVEGRALPAGHFIPEELPDETAAALRGFFSPPALA
ncbi:MAG: alpha/beta hydrolase [Rubrivivax sp.]|nr:alpha/beta hydrolase [Rubrivivax sp.]